MKLFESLGINQAGSAAAVTLHEYLSNRSVALFLRSHPNQLKIGSGIAIAIAGHRFVATAAHNIHGLELGQIEVVPAGRHSDSNIPVCRFNTHPLADAQDIDVAWLELDLHDFENYKLSFVDLDQIIPFSDEEDLQSCFVQGYPANRVNIQSDVNDHLNVESDGLLTLSIPSQSRSTPHQPRIDIAVEYPPHDASLDNHGLPDPPGVSGGGFWLFPRFENNQIWTPENAKLIGIARGWWQKERELLATRIEWWLELVAEDFPDIRLMIQEALSDFRND